MESPAVGINNIPLRNVDGMNSTSSTFLSSSLNMIETNVQGTSSTPDGEKPKGSLRTALNQNSPEFPDVNFEGRERPGNYSHKFDSKGNRTELSWFENLWVICYTFLCFFIAFILWVIPNPHEDTARGATQLILFVVGICLLLRVRLYRVKFNYDTRICEISYFRFLGNCFFPSRRARIPFDQIAYAKPYLRETCFLKICERKFSYYVSLVLGNKTSVRVTPYGWYWLNSPIRPGNTIEDDMESVSGRYVKSFNKFIINVLHNKELQIEAQKKRVLAKK